MKRINIELTEEQVRDLARHMAESGAFDDDLMKSPIFTLSDSEQREVMDASTESKDDEKVTEVKKHIEEVFAEFYSSDQFSSAEELKQKDALRILLLDVANNVPDLFIDPWRLTHGITRKVVYLDNEHERLYITFKILSDRVIAEFFAKDIGVTWNYESSITPITGTGHEYLYNFIVTHYDESNQTEPDRFTETAAATTDAFEACSDSDEKLKEQARENIEHETERAQDSGGDFVHILQECLSLNKEEQAKKNIRSAFKELDWGTHRSIKAFRQKVGLFRLLMQLSETTPGLFLKPFWVRVDFNGVLSLSVGALTRDVLAAFIISDNYVQVNTDNRSLKANLTGSGKDVDDLLTVLTSLYRNNEINFCQQTK